MSNGPVIGQTINSNTMDGLFNLLKPGPFKSVKNGDPEALLQDFEEYVEVMHDFFTTTGAAGFHVDPHTANCGACLKEKAMMRLIGGKEMDGLFKHWYHSLDHSVNGSIQTDERNAIIRNNRLTPNKLILLRIISAKGDTPNIAIPYSAAA